MKKNWRWWGRKREAEEEKIRENHGLGGGAACSGLALGQIANIALKNPNTRHI